MQLRPGARINRYTLVKPLGAGGQGAVWKVIDPLDGGAVRALKLIVVRDLDVAAADRARREARALSRAGHPALIACLELFEDPAEGLVGLVFEYVRGASLADAARDPRLSRRHRLAALEHLADALAHVHALGLVHRDLKPGNVLLTEAFWDAPNAPGGVKLLDFGIAAPAGNPHPLTAVGGMVGTGPYLSPELLAPGIWSAPAEGYARDLFAFGVLAWDLLLGAHPTGLPPTASLQEYAVAYRAAWEGGRPWPPPGPERPWAAAIAACLALDPRHRPPTGAVLLEILRGGAPAAAGERISAAAIAAVTAPHLGPSAAERACVPERASAHEAAPRTTPMPVPPVTAAPIATTVPMTPPSVRPSHPDGRPSKAAASRPSTPSRPSASTPPATPRPPGGRRWGSLLAALALIGAIAGIGWIAWTEMNDEMNEMNTPGASGPAPSRVSSPPPVGPALPSASTPPKASQTLSPKATPAPPDPPAPIPCCGKQGKCSSKRECDPKATNCRDVLPNRSWWLRPTGVNDLTGPTKQDMAEHDAHPEAQVCLRPAGAPDSEEACASLQAISRGSVDHAHQIAVKTADLESGAIEARVFETRGKTVKTLFKGRFRPLGWPKRTALCGGLRVPIVDGEHVVAEIFVFLDDP